VDRLQAQFDKHIYKFPTIQFWIAEVWLGRQDLDDDIRIGRPPLDDLDDPDDPDDVDAKILTILDKSFSNQFVR
jgi:hypothetical protein